jgi:hypothetical protein
VRYERAVREHHTKTKGDIGVLAAELDLLEKGFLLLKPLTEHAPFDTVAYRDGRFYRVQVKYRRIVNGSIYFSLKSSWTDRDGVHERPIDKSSIDLICVYCPDTRRCYYIDPYAVRKCVILRFEPTRNNQKKNVTWALNCIEIPSTVLGVAAGSRG